MTEEPQAAPAEDESMKPAEIIFEVTAAPGGGYDARALGYSIFTQGEDWDDLTAMTRDAVLCHFDDDEAPSNPVASCAARHARRLNGPTMESTRPQRPDDEPRTYIRAEVVVFNKTRAPYGGLSNMASGFPLRVNDVPILTSEALYQACRFPHRPDLQRLIIEQRSPMAAKRTAEPHRHDSRPDWNQVRVPVMRWCLRLKLAQNWRPFRDLLLSTGDGPIVEQSRKDDFWGAKPADDGTLVGVNALGRLLMDLRERVSRDSPDDLQRVAPLRIPDFRLYGRPVGVITGGRVDALEAEREVGSTLTHGPWPEASAAPLALRAAPPAGAAPGQGTSHGPEPAPDSGRLKPYPAYTDSRVDALGRVPAHWEVRQLGRVGRLFKGGGGTKEDDRDEGIPCVRYGDLYTQHRVFITGTRRFVAPELAATVYAPIQYGDVLFAGSGETIDEIGKSAVNLIRDRACCGGDVIVYRPSIDVDARFLGYATDSRPAVVQKARMGRGITVMHIYASDLKYMAVALPPRSEQAAIVRFLDHADRRIRRYIRAKEKLIALLEEQKQAIIHEAVTGQIDVRTGLPYSGYRDSRVTWLGPVPEHWGVPRLGDLGDSMVGLTYAPKDVVPRNSGSTLVLRASNVRDGRIVDADNVFVRSLVPEHLRTQVGDVLLCTRSGSRRLIGKNARIDASTAGVTFGAFMTVFRSPYNDYLHHVFNSRVFEYQSGAFSTSTINQLTLGVLRTMNVPWPDPSERAEIAAYLSEVVVGVAAVQRRVLGQRRLANELRGRLIADVVTGRLDVRDAAARLAGVERLDAGDDCEDGRAEALGLDSHGVQT